MMIINLVNRQVVIVTNVIRQIYAGNPHTSAALTFCTWTKSSAARRESVTSKRGVPWFRETRNFLQYLIFNVLTKLLTPGLPGAVHGDLHALAVDGEDGGGARDQDAQVEALAAPAAADEAKVVELGHVVLQIR